MVFNYRNWKTVYNAAYWVTTENTAEETNLLAEVDADEDEPSIKKAARAQKKKPARAKAAAAAR